MRIAGVDPGGSGALALLLPVENRLVVEDMPVFRVQRGKGTRTEVDVHGLVRILSDWSPTHCFFEKVGGMEGDGPSAAFNFGRATGAAEAVVKIIGGQFRDPAPHVWKKAMKLTGKAKDDSRLLATNLWPANAADFSRKKDDGRAEAALLAEYGRRVLLSEGIFG